MRLPDTIDDPVLSTEETGAGSAVVGRSPRQLIWSRFRQDRAAMAGAVAIAILVVLAVAAPLIARLFGHGPNDLHPEMTTPLGLPDGPNGRFWFGVDAVGRDVLVRTIYGARTSLTVAFVATGIAFVFGLGLGMLAGFRGGWVDTVISRSIDIILALPLLLFAIGIAATCSVNARGCLGGLIQPGVRLVVILIALFTWPYIARIVRGQTLSIRESGYVEAARALGAGTGHILAEEIFPNLLTPVIVYTTLLIPSNILFEAALSFLGVGIPQSTPSWGGMLAQASQGELFTYAWWMMLFPGLFLLLTTLAFNLVGDGIRDAVDPHGIPSRGPRRSVIAERFRRRRRSDAALQLATGT